MKSHTKSSSPPLLQSAPGLNGGTPTIPGYKGSSSSNAAAYPSISAAYWLPAPNTTPYMIPGEQLTWIYDRVIVSQKT